MRNVFIIGSKGIPSQYGGFETFVDNLTQNKKCDDIKYHVSCMGKDNSEFDYNGVRCFNIKVKNIGSAKAIIYDISSLLRSVDFIRKNNLKDCVIYILACRIGPFLNVYKKYLTKVGIKIYVNPDGHEWKRSKWNKLIKKYWKISEKLMVKNSDLLICDSEEIQRYIEQEYRKYDPRAMYISYGADLSKSKIDNNDSTLTNWYSKNKISIGQYYLMVGRFVPENNVMIIIQGFMKSNTKKDLVIITNVEENKFYKDILANTKFDHDKKIKFVGTVYDKETLKKIRENAYCYIHGHEVGGTNPSLLEALASTKINILLNVNFNKEVAQDGALYFEKNPLNISKLIDKVDNLNEIETKALGKRAYSRIKDDYSWDKIIYEYEKLFNNM